MPGNIDTVSCNRPDTAAGSPAIEAFFDQDTFTVSYVVCDPAPGAAAVIDSVLDYDAAAGKTSTASADTIAAFVKGHGLEVEWLLETHAAFG